MFIHFVLAFIFVVLVFYQLPEFPPVWSGIASGCLVVLLISVLPFKFFKSYYQQSAYPVQRRVKYTLNIFFGLIISWTWVFWQAFFMPTISESLLNIPVYLTGQVVEIPINSHLAGKQRTKYQIKVESIQIITSFKSVMEQPKKSQLTTYQYGLKPNVYINWYFNKKLQINENDMPKIGEIWQFRVKLKANHGSMNPNGLDYEAWLFQQHIDAKGYVKKPSEREMRLIKATEKSKYSLKKSEDLSNPTINTDILITKIANTSSFSPYFWRQLISQRLSKVFSQSKFAPLYKALSYGDKSLVSDKNWQLLRGTGTIHLMAISGLHMGIVALMGFMVFKGLWWLGLYRLIWVNRPGLTAMGALLFATLYLLVSGFSIPTQRAWLMIVAILGFIIIKRQFQPWSAIAMAALLVVIWDSRSVLSLGFWLSFLAVSLIFALIIQPKLTANGTVSKKSSRLLRVKQGIKIQLLLTIGLAPFLIWAFQGVPSYSFIANLIAVPFISLIGLPVLLLSAFLSLFSIELAQMLIMALDMAWVYLWEYLHWVNLLPKSQLTFPKVSLIWLILVYGLIFYWLKHKAWKVKFLILIGFILLTLAQFFVFSNDLNRPKVGEAWLSILDVGQGQAIVIETKNVVVVYDTGAKWGPSMDGAKLALIPYLKQQAWLDIEMLIVSHSDNDHAGGHLRLLQTYATKHLLSGQPKEMNQIMASNSDLMGHIISKGGKFSLCHKGQIWEHDGVKFEILSPIKSKIGNKLKTDNDLSCVLRITAGGYQALITGDLSSRGEKILIKEYQKNQESLVAKDNILNADLLVAGHHGSKYSTHHNWLASVKPSKIVFTSGYMNRFNFPAKQVIQRIKPLDIQWWNTACSGALQFLISNQGVSLLKAYRKSQRKWYHHSCLQDQQGHLFQ